MSWNMLHTQLLFWRPEISYTLNFSSDVLKHPTHSTSLLTSWNILHTQLLFWRPETSYTLNFSSGVLKHPTHSTSLLTSWNILHTQLLFWRPEISYTLNFSWFCKNLDAVKIKAGPKMLMIELKPVANVSNLKWTWRWSTNTSSLLYKSRI